MGEYNKWWELYMKELGGPSKYWQQSEVDWQVPKKEPEIKTPAIEGPATYSTLDELIGAETY
jgi:hypothetical protein